MSERSPSFSNKERDKLQDSFGKNRDQAECLKHWEELEELVRQESRIAIAVRELYGPPPSEEEKTYGDYAETIPLPMRRASSTLRRKGYVVEDVRIDDETGEQCMRFSHAGLSLTPELDALTQKLGDRGDALALHSDYLSFVPSAETSLEECGLIWDQVSQLISDLHTDIPVNDSLEAEKFRRNAETPHAYLKSPKELQTILDQSSLEARQIVASLTMGQRDNLKRILSFPVKFDKPSVLLVVAGLKPAAFFPVSGEATMTEILMDLKACGLHADMAKGSEESVYRIFVARDSETLQKLKEASPTKDHEAFGKLMGYPTSAIEGFMRGSSLITGPSEISSDLTFPLRLSQDHWPEELQVVARWSYVVKFAEEEMSENQI